MDLREFLEMLDILCPLPTQAEVEAEIRCMGIQPDAPEMVWE